jgi:hypothetical protein
MAQRERKYLQDAGILYPTWLHEPFLQHESLILLFDGGSLRYGENQIKKLQLWLHVPALVVGFALALGGIPLYQNDAWSCYIPSPALAEVNRDLLIFTVVPICTSIVIATVNMVLVYWAVRKQMIAARKWKFGGAAIQQASASSLSRNTDLSGESFQPRRRQSVIQKMERQTFWQALFYLGAFDVTVPILLVASFHEGAQDSYPFILVALFLGPMQGFLNFLVYFRPRVQKRMEERRKTRRQLQQAAKDAAAKPKDTVLGAADVLFTGFHRGNSSLQEEEKRDEENPQLQQAAKDTAAKPKDTVLGATDVLFTGFHRGNSSLQEEEKRDEENPQLQQAAKDTAAKPKDTVLGAADVLLTGFHRGNSSLREEENRGEKNSSETQNDMCSRLLAHRPTPRLWYSPLPRQLQLLSHRRNKPRFWPWL